MSDKGKIGFVWITDKLHEALRVVSQPKELQVRILLTNEKTMKLTGPFGSLVSQFLSQGIHNDQH